MADKRRWIGLVLVIVGSISWGASGTVADYMFLTQHVPVLWVVVIRMFLAGILLLLTYKITVGGSIFMIWHDKSQALLLISFAIFGMLMSQFSYLSAVRYGNAATATVLQFTTPVFIIIYYSISRRKLPVRLDVISIILAVVGTYLLATKGDFGSLTISKLGLFFGISAGIAGANCTLIPIKLLNKYDPRLVCGWAMLLGSLPIQPIVVIDTPHVNINETLIFELIFITIVGTMIAYLFYVASLNYLEPAVTGTLSSFEPLTAAILSVSFLHLKLTLVEVIGGLLILMMAFVQALPQKNKLE